MKNSAIKLSLISALLTSYSAMADLEPPRPTPDLPTNPIEGTPVHPTLPEKDISVPGIPVRPQPPAVPEQPPVDNSPTRPQPTNPSNPIEGDDVDVPNISGPTEAERSSTLEMLSVEYNNRLNQQAEQIDGIRAGLHAVTNARPFVTNGEFAVGAGVGFSGSKEAVALGGAYGINENLSISGTFHYETSGKYSPSDVAGGIGLQYNFN